MRTYKKELPAGVKKKFILKVGRKVKIVNSLYAKKKKENKKTA